MTLRLNNPRWIVSAKQKKDKKKKKSKQQLPWLQVNSLTSGPLSPVRQPRMHFSSVFFKNSIRPPDATRTKRNSRGTLVRFLFETSGGQSEGNDEAAMGVSTPESLGKAAEGRITSELALHYVTFVIWAWPLQHWQAPEREALRRRTGSSGARRCVQ